MRRAIGILVCALLGCGPVVVPGDGDGSGSAGSTGGSTSATAATISATGTSTLGSATIADGNDDEHDDDGPGGWDCGAAPPGQLPRCIGVPMCDPPPMPGVVAWISVDGRARSTRPETHAYACTIADWEDGPSQVTLALECADGPHTLEVGTPAGIWFDAEGDFVLTVVHSGATFEGADVLATLRRADGSLVLAGASTPWPPDAAAVPEGFFDPLDVALRDDVCPVEPLSGGGFIEACYAVERQALRFGLGGEALDVYDHGVDQLPPFILAVQHAEQRHQLTCSDTPDRWYSWVAVPPLLD
jgi:hypothetical protein